MVKSRKGSLWSSAKGTLTVSAPALTVDLGLSRLPRTPLMQPADPPGHPISTLPIHPALPVPTEGPNGKSMTLVPHLLGNPLTPRNPGDTPTVGAA